MEGTERIMDSRLWPKSLDEETAGSPQFGIARLEEPLDDEQEKSGEDDPSRIGPEETLMTKNPDVPCTKRRNVFSGTNG